METDDAQFSSRLLAGRYRIQQPRGTGSNGAVFDAVDEQLDRVVAIKLVSRRWVSTPEMADRFRAEAQVAASLTHPNVNAVFDFGMEDVAGEPTPYLVLEHLGGGSLRDILDRGRLLSPSQMLAVGLDVCRGLDYIHRRGILHRDLKPANLVFGEDRHVRIVDVGLSRLIAEQAWADPSAVGTDTARYASPEQAQGVTPETGLSTATDIYSLCIILIEAVTGQVPFAADSTVATLSGRIDKLMPVSADFGPLASILERAGRPLAQDRYSAGELGRALVQAAERLPRPAPVPIVGGGLFGDLTGGIRRPTLPAAQDESPTNEQLDEPTMAQDLAIGAVQAAEQTESVGSLAVVDGAGVVTGNADSMLAETHETDDDSGALLYDQEVEIPRSRWWLLAALLLVASLIGGGVFAYRQLTTKSHLVPELVGLSEGVARNQVADLGWRVVTIHERSDDQPQGNVIKTDPAAGADLEEEKSLTLIVSDGPTLPKLPDVTGQTLDAATATLGDKRLVLAIAAEEFSEDVPDRVVISWSVPAQPGLTTGMEVVQQTVVAVVVSKGPAPRLVPDLTGVDQVTAEAALAALQLTIAIGEPVFSDTVPIGSVVSQVPAPNEALGRGLAVTVQLSKGIDLVTIPVVDGMDATAVQAVLVAAGLTSGTITGDPTQAISGLSVGGVAVAAGQQIKRGTPIDLTFPAPPTTTLALVLPTVSP